MEDRLGARGAPALRAAPEGRAGGLPTPRPVNPRNPHMTAGIVCSHCGTQNHTSAQCWTLHPELCPFPKRQNALMTRVKREGERAERALEAELDARAERSHRYDSERYNEKRGEEEDDDDMDCRQYMVDHVYRDDDLPKSLGYSDLFDLDDPALEAELQLMSTPIADSVEELRRLQKSSDRNGGVASPEEQVDGWFSVGKEKKIHAKSKMQLTLTL